MCSLKGLHDESTVSLVPVIYLQVTIICNYTVVRTILCSHLHILYLHIYIYTLYHTLYFSLLGPLKVCTNKKTLPLTRLCGAFRWLVPLLEQ